MNTTTDTQADEQIRRTMIEQIGRQTVLAISGGRILATGPTTIVLPVSNGYSVEVEYVYGQDLYTVRRIFARGGKRWIKGEVDRVYCDQLDEVCWIASCFRSYETFGEVI